MKVEAMRALYECVKTFCAEKTLGCEEWKTGDKTSSLLIHGLPEAPYAKAVSGFSVTPYNTDSTT